MLAATRWYRQRHPILQRPQGRFKTSTTICSRSALELARYKGCYRIQPESSQPVWRLPALMETGSTSASVQLLGTSVLMFLGAYGCGMLPSYVSAGEEAAGNISALGAGLLLGSALAIILPEGFEAAHEGSLLPEWGSPLALLAGFWCMLVIDMLSQMLPSSGTSRSTSSSQQDTNNSTHKAEESNQSETVDAHSILLSEVQPRPGTPTSRHGRESAGTAAQSAPVAGSSSRKMVPNTAVTVDKSPANVGASGFRHPTVSEWLKDPSQQALLGLMVHAAADGLAVGSSALSSQPSVSLSVAIAMVVHKGPVAMGLATYLRDAQWSSRRIHTGILLFAAVSPLAALLTYLLLTFISSTTSQGSSIPLAVLFSGGTVLYAATMHILPSALGSHQHQHECDTLRSESERRSRTQQMLVHTNKKAKQLLYVSVGMLVPLMLSAVVHHEH